MVDLREVDMRIFVHVDEDGRIDGTMPEFNVNAAYDEETGAYVDVETPNVLPGDIENGWFAWPFGESVPENFWEYGIVDGALVHLGEEPPTAEELRAQDVADAHNDLPEIQDGLMEVAAMAADHETSINDLEEAIIELAAMIGGGTNG